MSDSELRKCLQDLEALKAKFDAFFPLFGDRDTLFGPDRLSAQEMLRHLKDVLKTECHRVSGARREAALNPTERAYYAPAVEEASANLNVRVNSIPDGRVGGGPSSTTAW